MTKGKTVAIIGAGACGLVCAKTLLDDGFNVTLFDRQKELGGTWTADGAYADLHSQQPGGTLEFADLFNGEEFAPWQHVHRYLQKYADLFHITERIHFQTRVLSVAKDDMKNDLVPWIIKTETNHGQQETHEFGFVVIASGLYSQPYIPEYPGQKKFAGPILPPSAIKSHEQVANKRVVVVGHGKCATDMAVLSGRHARSCHMIFRKAHWMTPRRIVNGLLPVRMLFTRLFAMPFTPMPNAPQNNLFSFLHEKYPKFFTALTDIISNDILSAHGSDLSDDRIMIPQHSYRNLENISIIPNDFLRLKREGRIVGKLGIISEIVDETTIRLNSGEELQTDLIISATGFIRHFPFFTPQQSEMLGLTTSSDGTELNLYRRVVPVGVPNIAFIGYTGSVGYWMIAEAASHWISNYFIKRQKLPTSEDQMRDEIKTNHAFVRSIFRRGEHDYRYYWIAPMEIYLSDMGLDLHRTSNWITEYFGVYRPERLKSLHHERKQMAETGRKPRRFYLSFEMTIMMILFLLVSLFLL